MPVFEPSVKLDIDKDLQRFPLLRSISNTCGTEIITQVSIQAHASRVSRNLGKTLMLFQLTSKTLIWKQAFYVDIYASRG
jgi:hypothetical protein